MSGFYLGFSGILHFGDIQTCLFSARWSACTLISSDSSYLPVFGSPILAVTLLNHSLNTAAFCLIFSSPNSGALSLTTVNSSHGPSSVKSEPMSPSQQQQQQSHLRPPSNSGMPGSPHSIHSHHSPVTSPVPPDYEHQSMSKRPRMDTSWNQV